MSAIFKIGGKILENLEDLKSTISQLTQVYDEGLLNKIIIIPGGGSLANFIRKVYSELQFTEELGHWMGIISMNYNGIELGKKFPEIEVVEDINKLKKIEKIFSIFLPYRFLKEDDKLPQSWDVTSDSITLYLAKELEITHCFLIKDIDGILNKDNLLIKELTTSEYKKMKTSGNLSDFKNTQGELKDQSRPVDSYLFTLIEELKIPCVILNGKSNTQRIIDYYDLSISNSDKIFSIIK
ncbi:MAG: amino acid kinase family protein [Promethearchaeota archaeon]